MIQLPNNYRFTEADVDRGCEILVRYFEDKPVSEEELELEVLTSAAWWMYCDTRKWPTVSQVSAYLNKQEEEREQRYVNSLTKEAQEKYWGEKKRQQNAKQTA